jgi:hypothetical protein
MLIADNVDGLLLCWYFIIVSLATEAELKTKVQNIFYCSIALCRLELLLISEPKVDAALGQPA